MQHMQQKAMTRLLPVALDPLGPFLWVRSFSAWGPSWDGLQINTGLMKEVVNLFCPSRQTDSTDVDISDFTAVAAGYTLPSACSLILNLGTWWSCGVHDVWRQGLATRELEEGRGREESEAVRSQQQ